jgi:hypothetical protein
MAENTYHAINTQAIETQGFMNFAENRKFRPDFRLGDFQAILSEVQ